MTWHEKVFAGPIITYDGFITSLVDYNFHNKIFSSVTDNKLRYIYIYIYIYIYLFIFFYDFFNYSENIQSLGKLITVIISFFLFIRH